MKTTHLGRTGLKVSRLCLGGARYSSGWTLENSFIDCLVFETW